MSKKQKKHKSNPTDYRKRSYRRLVNSKGLLSFEVQVRETDLHILAPLDLSLEARNLVIYYRNQLENYLVRCPEFLQALSPLPHDHLAPPMVQQMYKAAQDADVGPMATVAGVVAEYVGRSLMAQYELSEIMVENGGDIFLQRQEDCTIAIFAGSSPLSNKVGIKIAAGRMPLGICTSSATVGHSLSLGKADAVTVLASQTALADASATRLGNEVSADNDFDKALAIASSIQGLQGVVIIKGEKIGAWGNIELVGL